MIPARLGSKRVPKKNLRLINGKPLISYILDTVSKCKCFSEIYLNSEAEIFNSIAKKHSVKFYKRNEKFSLDTSTNDEFGLDFIKNVSGDILIQILPTSPFITTKEIETFVATMVGKKYDSLISVENKQIACIYNNQPINFHKLKPNPPSQKMAPVQAYATVLMGWKYSSFLNNMTKFNCAYHGGEGKTGYFEIKGLSTLDIDNEEDFQLVEKIILSESSSTKKINYYSNE